MNGGFAYSAHQVLVNLSDIGLNCFPDSFREFVGFFIRDMDNISVTKRVIFSFDLQSVEWNAGNGATHPVC